MTQTPSAPVGWMQAARAALPPHRLKQILLTVGDQGLVSAGTFLVNVLLARQISQTSYGVFVLSYSAINFSIDLQNALVLEPLMVFGPGKPDSERRSYMATALVLQVAFTTALVALTWLAVAGYRLIAGPGAALGTVALMAVGMIGIHSREFVRKMFFSTLEPSRALRNDALYLALLLSVLFGVSSRFGISAGAAYVVLGIAGVATALIGTNAAGVRLNLSRVELREAVVEHWRYGKWMIGVSGARWAGNEMYFFVAAAFLGPTGSAALKAVQNIFAPVSLFLSGLGNLFLPVASRLATRPTVAALNRFAIVLGACLGPPVLCYVAFVTFWPKFVFGLLYHGNYLEYAYLVPLVGMGYILSAAFQGPSLGLRALAQSRAIFVITTIAATATTVAVVPLTAKWGLVGSLVAVLLSYLVGSPLWALHYRRAARARELVSR